MDLPWPTVDDVAARLRLTVADFTDVEQEQLRVFRDSAEATARQVPALREAVDVPPNVWDAVVGLAALDYWMANPSSAVIDPDVNPANPSSARWRYMMQMGHGRGGKPRVG